jgi:hypothetical protein
MKFDFPKVFQQLSSEQRVFWEYYKECVLNIEKLYTVSTSISPNITDFLLINTKNAYRVLNSWNVMDKNNSFKLVMLEYKSYQDFASVTGGSRHYYYDPYLIGMLNTFEDFGHVLIRPETFADKIIEIFNGIETDFAGHRKFSNMFYVISDNKEKTLVDLKNSFLDFFIQFPKLEVEFLNKKCVFRLEKAIDFAETEMLCKIGMKLDAMFKLHKTTH